MERIHDSDSGLHRPFNTGGFFQKLGFGERISKVFDSTNSGSDNSLRGRLSQLNDIDASSTFIPLARMGVLPKGEQSISGFKQLEFTGIHPNWVTEIDFLITNNLIGDRLIQKRVPVLFTEKEMHLYIKDNLLSCFHELANRSSSIVSKNKINIELFRSIIHSDSHNVHQTQQRIIAEIRGMIPKRFDSFTRQSGAINADLEEYKRQHPNISLFSGKIDGKSTYFFIEEVSREFRQILPQNKMDTPKIRNVYLRIGDLPIYQGTLKTEPIQ